MAEQPRYDPLEPSRFFADGQSARHPVAGTVARGRLRDDPHFFAGRKTAAEPGEPPALERPGDYFDTFPLPVTSETVRRGRERFRIYCAPCHGRNGGGNGPVVERGYPAAESFHTDKLRGAPVGYFFDVITRGHKAMPAYARQVPADDRWAIIAYVRALQLSRHARLEELPADVRRRFAEHEGDKR
jgi:mono/diheme cytochrome c family protein